MPASALVKVRVDLQRVRENAIALRERVGVPVIAVVKADCYGLGLAAIAPVIADAVDGFCVFQLDEARAVDLHRLTRKPIMSIGPDEQAASDDYIEQGVRPAVWTIERAAALRSARPIVSINTGMQRFAASQEDLDAILAAGDCDEAFTHAVRLGQVQRLLDLAGDRGLRLHASATALLDEPSARLDAVRPGLALYRGAACVETHLIEATDTLGPAGYTGFVVRRHGVIPMGYLHGLRPGPCLVNEHPSRVLEVGMQTAFVELSPTDEVGDAVTLLGGGLSEQEVAASWQTSEQQVLTQLCASGIRQYI